MNKWTLQGAQFFVGAAALFSVVTVSNAVQNQTTLNTTNQNTGHTETLEKDYYFASSNAKNRYFFNRDSIEDKPEISATVKAYQSLWVMVEPLKEHPGATHMEMHMLADCSTNGKVGFTSVKMYDSNGVLLKEEKTETKNFEWFIAEEKTSFGVNWNATCTHIIWPSTAHFPQTTSTKMSQLAREANPLWATGEKVE